MPANLGDLVRVVGVFRATSTGAVQDPTVVKVSVRRPGGKVETWTYGDADALVAKDSTGTYHLDISANVPGRYYYRWWSTGTGQAGIEKFVDVLDAKAQSHP
jgi:hypothetical protein